MSEVRLSAAQQLLQTNRDRFEELVERARRAVQDEDVAIAAARVQSAARFAWLSHPGVFRSRDLESLTRELAQRLPTADAASIALDGRVLHVATQLYSTGGHTRLISRWIENDSARAHSVVVTAQGGLSIPEHVRSAADRSGGRIIDLARGAPTLTARAARLRQIADAGVSAVVLHTHPHDVVPSLGLQRVAAPIIFLNHADHVFSLGLDVADVVADIRPAGRALSWAARGVVASRSALLPVPLAEPPTVDRAAARRRWSIPEGATVLLSIANEYKFGASPGEHFVDVHMDFIRDHPDTWLIVVGPRPEGRWAELAEATDGRARAIGVVQGVHDLYAAADIYVDSIPFASLTSLLDAAARGLPTVALSGRNTGTVLSSDDVALSGHAVHFADRRDYLSRLHSLVTDVALRHRAGRETRRAVIEWHMGSGWTSRLDAVVSGVDATNASTPTDAPLTAAQLATLDEELVVFQQAAGLSIPAWESELIDAPVQPLRFRLALMRRVPPGRRAGSLKYLLADRLRARIGSAGRRMFRMG